MSDSPKYVRLAARLSDGIVADVFGSGWSIAGKDVKEFPEDKAAARFVRQGLDSGKLEPASKAEHEEVHGVENEAEAEMLKQNPDFGKNLQEHKLREATAEGAERLGAGVEARLAEEEEAELAAAEEDRQARLAAQEEAGLNDDDIERQQAGTEKRSSVSKAKKTKKSAKKAAAESTSS